MLEPQSREELSPGSMVTATAPGSTPSLQSDAVTNELQELSIQSSPCALPLQERKNVLQLRLQQRRTREELVGQGIMPPLKSPAAFHEQRRSLERARTEDYLKRKIKTRPERSELVRMHILEETSAEPSLQAKQLKLKRARLADNLNDKISHRPGPMELMQKNILPVLHCSLKHTIAEEEFPRGAGESSSLDEDSSDALSPDQPANHSSPLGHASLPSPPDMLTHSNNPSPTQFLSQVPLISASEPSLTHRFTNGTPALTGSRPSAGSTKSRLDRPSQRSKKAKDSKPKVKKLKYHQYIPPDQKAEREPPPQMDDSYAKILHQQQLFLQLQIINQQQQHYNYHTILPAPPKPSGDPPSSSNTSSSQSRNVPTSSTASSNQSGLSRQSQVPVGGAKPGTLPSNLDELKVAELKLELKLRSLPVSGTKMDLIERLRNYQEQSRAVAGPGCASGSAAQPKNSPAQQQHPQLPHAQPAGSSPSKRDRSAERGLILASLPAVATVGTMHFSSTSSSPPLSPTNSDRSCAGMSLDETSCNGDVFGEMVSSPLTQLSLYPSPQRESTSPPSAGACLLSQRASLSAAGSPDKDRMLQEKDRQIEELTRMLLQNQRLVENLRSQLEQGKRGPPVKEEHPEVKEEAEPGAEEKQPETRSRSSRPLQILLQLEDQSQGQVQLQKSPGDQSPGQVQLQQTAQLQQGQQKQKRRPRSEQMSPVILSSQSSTPEPTPSFSLDLFETHPAPTLLTDSNGNHYLIAVTNHEAESQCNGRTRGKAAGRITLQRLHSSPSKISVQSANQPASTDSQLKQPLQPCLVTQPVIKEQKPDLHVATSSSQEAGLSLSDPANPQAFYLNNDSAPSGGHTPSSPSHKLIGEGSSSLDQHTLFKPPSPATNLPSTSPQHKGKRCCDQRIDDLFDILIQSGEISSGLKAAPDPSLSRSHPSSGPLPSPTHSTVHPSPPSPPDPVTSRGPSEDLPMAPRAPGYGGRTCAGSGRLEDFLESTTGAPLIGVEPDGPVTLIDDLHNQMLSTSSILDHPPSPMDTCELSFTPQHPGLDFGDAALDSMDWLDITMGGTGGVGPAPLSSHMPSSVFSVDFLDSPDLQLHWESCM